MCFLSAQLVQFQFLTTMQNSAVNNLQAKISHGEFILLALKRPQIRGGQSPSDLWHRERLMFSNMGYNILNYTQINKECKNNQYENKLHLEGNRAVALSCGSLCLWKLKNLS